MIKEGKAEIIAETPKIVSKKMGVFYNPVMRLNRTLSVLVVKSFFDRKIRIADPLSATGVRAIRMLKEAGEKVEKVYANDYSTEAVKLIRKNIEKNKIEKEKIDVSNNDANLFLLENNGFDYIDIDPFGTPNPFLDSAVKRIARNGILAVTATDTAALTGTFENACKRKYWAIPLRNYLMHEIGLRILIRKIQLIGCQYEKALIPVLSYSKEHYYRIFFKCEKGKKKCDEIIKQHKFFQGKYGPIWAGKLSDTKLLQKMLEYADAETTKFLEVLKDESEINQVGFYSMDEVAKESKKPAPKIKEILEKLKNKKIKASRTHFAGNAIKCECSLKELSSLL